MKKLTITQWGKNRSIVTAHYLDTGEKLYLIMDNDYLMHLDELGLIS